MRARIEADGTGTEVPRGRLETKREVTFAWRVEDGDAVEAGDALIEVESGTPSIGVIRE